MGSLQRVGNKQEKAANDALFCVVRNSGFLGVGVTATNDVSRHFHASGKKEVLPGRSRRSLRR